MRALVCNMLVTSHNIDEGMIDSLVCGISNLLKTIKTAAEPVLLETVFKSNMAFIRCYDWTKNCRKELPALDSYLSQIENGVVSVSSHIGRFIRYFAYNAVELNYYPWISVSSYSRGTHSHIPEPTISNTYLKPDEVSFPDAFSRVYRSIDASAASTQTLITMVTGIDSARIVALWNPDRPDFVPTMEKSDVNFILVEYGHPKMKGLIQIQLPDSVYMVGNEILSKAFVLRHLDHSCIPNTWHFDEDYIVRIIDHNADSLEIGSHQYVVLEKEGYRVAEDEYADLPDLITEDSIDELMCVSDSENESPAGYISEEYEANPSSTKRTYSIEDTVFVLDDFLEDCYSNKIDSFSAKPKQE